MAKIINGHSTMAIDLFVVMGFQIGAGIARTLGGDSMRPGGANIQEMGASISSRYSGSNQAISHSCASPPYSLPLFHTRFKYRDTK